MTAAELYEFVRGLPQRYATAPPLEAYLTSLWQVVRLAQPATPNQALIASWLAAAFEKPPPSFDPSWLDLDSDPFRDVRDFNTWEILALGQIADLKRMAVAGQLGNDLRYFGITSPSGQQWYNFDPFTFLECGAAAIQDNPLLQQPSGWELFGKLLLCGQIYE